jgi:hypothetical protein
VSASLVERAVVDASPTDTFIYDKDGVNFTFTFTANANGDIWFSMAAPNKFGWMAVGTGSQMDGALMFVAYGDGTASGTPLIVIEVEVKLTHTTRHDFIRKIRDRSRRADLL